MSMTDKLKDTLNDQVDAWEKQLNEQKAKLKNEYASHKAENSREALYESGKEKLEDSIDQLKRKISVAKAQIDDMVDA